MHAPTVNARPEKDQDGALIPGSFSVFDVREGKHTYLFTLSNRGDRLGNLLKRGIPADDARTLFYQMDT